MTTNATDPQTVPLERMRQDVMAGYAAQNEQCRRRADEPIEAFAADWGVDKGAASIALNFEMLIESHGGVLRMDDLAELARRIKAYGDDRLLANCHQCEG